jgi:tol-pal system protein YbgF
MKRSVVASVVAGLALSLMAGCATVEPKDFRALQGQMTHQQRQLRELDKRVSDLSTQIERGRRPRAELTSEVASLRQEMMRLSGRIEETNHRLGQAPQASDIQAATKDLTAKTVEAEANQQKVDKRLARLEAYLGFKGKKGAAPKSPRPAASAAQTKPANPYDLGLRLYKQKSYKAARDRFAEYVKKYPKSKKAPRAQYWIGETYYVQKKYEEAILAYNQVIKRYPRSSRVPSALLKQGLAFRALGDKRTAKIVLTKLVKKHPKTSQARLAKKVLRKL